MHVDELFQMTFEAKIRDFGGKNSNATSQKNFNKNLKKKNSDENEI